MRGNSRAGKTAVSMARLLHQIELQRPSPLSPIVASLCRFNLTAIFGKALDAMELRERALRGITARPAGDDV